MINIRMSILRFLTFLSIYLITFSSAYTQTDKCVTLELINDRHFEEFFESYSYTYHVIDTCDDKILDTIFTSSGIGDSDDMLYCINCYPDSCFLLEVQILSKSHRFDTIFAWDHEFGPPPYLNLFSSKFDYSTKLFIFKDYSLEGGEKSIGSFVTHIVDSVTLDTLEFLPMCQRPIFSSDKKQIIFEKSIIPLDPKVPENALFIYDIEDDTSYNPLASDHSLIYYPERVSKDSYLYYLADSPPNRNKNINLYRTDNFKNEEKLTHLKLGDIIVDYDLINDTSLVCIIKKKDNDYKILEYRYLYFTE